MTMQIIPFLKNIFRMDSSAVSTKENILLLMFTIAIWLASVTVILPLVFILAISSNLRKFVHRWNMEYKCEGIDVLSKSLFFILRDTCPQFDFRKLRFLQLGTRMSFDEYSEQHEIDVVCDNLKCSELHGMNKKIHICSEDILKNCKENTYDVVVSTFFLCSVKNPESALNDIRRTLKPGGKFAFLEHCGYPENEFSYKFQRLIAPFWQMVFRCRLNHHPSHLLMRSSFHSLNYKTYYDRNRLVFYRPVIVGVCTK